MDDMITPKIPPQDSAASSDEQPLSTETVGTTPPAANPSSVPSTADNEANQAKDSLHAKTPKAAIIAAIIIALILASLTIIAYLKTRDDGDTPAAESTTQTQTEEQATRNVTGGDIDDTTQEIDQTLSEADDSEDFNANDLSDEALGL